MANPAATASTDLSAELHHGDPHMIDYTPSGNDVKGGDLIAINATSVGVAHSDITDGELGALAWPGGNASYRVKLGAGESFAFGAAVNVDPGLDGAGEAKALGTHHFGYCVVAADTANGDTHVYAVHAPVAS